MEYRKVTKKGQVTIPLELRKFLGIKTGERVAFDLERGKVTLKKPPADPIADLVGIGKGIFPKGLEYQRKMRREWEER